MVSDLNYFDVVLLLVILLSSFLAFNKGLIRSVLSVVGWAASIVLTYQIFPYIEEILLRHMSQFAVLVIGYGGVLIFFLLFFAVLNYAIFTAFGAVCGSTADKLLGCVFGVARGYVVVVLLFVAIIVAFGVLDGSGHSKKDVHAVSRRLQASGKNPTQSLPAVVSRSMSYPFLLSGTELLVRYVPEVVAGSLHLENAPQVAPNGVTNEKIIMCIRLLSKYADTETLQQIKNESERRAKGRGMTELELGVYAVQKLMDVYITRCERGEIPKEHMLSEKELNDVHQVLHDVNEQLKLNKADNMHEEKANSDDNDEGKEDVIDMVLGQGSKNVG